MYSVQSNILVGPEAAIGGKPPPTFSPGSAQDTGRLQGRRAFALDLRRPVKPRWPNAGLNPWATRQDAGLAALGQGWPIAAAHGFKPSFGHTEPKRGAEWWGKSPFGYFWGSFPKVTRCKSGTHSSRCRSNGYVLGPIQHPGQPRGRHRGQAPSHIFTGIGTRYRSVLRPPSFCS
ncbi:hypothetical protein [Pseudomonas sp. 28 E 9]|nr:hypothetical protein [Pseudomonas sp. 28 E 9]